MPKLLSCLAVILWPFLAWPQKTCMFRLIKTAGEISKPPANQEKIVSVGYSQTGEEVMAYTYHNKKIVLLSRLVWGYQDNNCTIYRNTGGHFFKVEQADEMVIYSLQSKGLRNRLTTFYYFSRGLDGPVYLMDNENLAEQFKDNACFVKKLKQKFNSPFNQDYAVKSNHSFTIVEMLRACK